jgi:excinuclease ABC subunit B
MSEKTQPSLFSLKSPFQLRGDQPEAVNRLEEWVRAEHPFMTLLGVTGSGKTFTMANVIARLQKPTLIVTHNKTLAAQLYSEFKEFFPENAVEYFVSYYDYFQPEAYIPGADQYIEKDSDINEEIDRFRHSATSALFSRRDVIVVASVSCIYGLGSPGDYSGLRISLKRGATYPRQALLADLTAIQYSRNDMDFHRSRFRARGETVDIFPAASEEGIRVRFFGDEIDRLERFSPVTGETSDALDAVDIFPAQHHVTTPEKRDRALLVIEEEMKERVRFFEEQKKAIEAQRIYERTCYDLEMIRETGSTKGIENYSRHMTGRGPGEPPETLVHYLPRDCIIFLDESHMTVPQLRGMCNGDRSRKGTLIDYGFRLPSALDNRPLTFDEFLGTNRQIVFVSATPGAWEKEVSGNLVAEQLIRPTGLLDPRITVHPTTGQIDHLIGMINGRLAVGERVLVTTMTKRMARELAEHFSSMGIPSRYLHDEIETLERIQILRDLRMGVFQVLVGVNMLREGLDLPEVSLVAVLDADKQGFLRSAWALIQTCGRAARNVNGEVILYGDTITPAMKTCLDETIRRRAVQDAYNQANDIKPASIVKEMPRPFLLDGPEGTTTSRTPKEDAAALIEDLRHEMDEAAKQMQFERAALIRDEIITLQEQYLESDILGRLGEALRKGRDRGMAKKGRRSPRSQNAPTAKVPDRMRSGPSGR